MSNEILYILLPDFASHEMVYLMEAISSDEAHLKSNPKYINKVVAPSLEPVTAIGGFKVLPDYSFDTMPEDYA
ncbi:MAG: glutamine amidotransferase, partial [Muribaculaceae bacterium]|nr:glutamine amidotransferase [Muribaculaceae bacterium]